MTTDSYKAAGVDIAAGEALVERIKPIVAKTKRPEVLTGLGQFAALFSLPINRYRQPVLVSCTDGVGTKLKLAIAHQAHHAIGIDLVAMSVNDLLVCGAEPLFFLDYYATGKLDVDTAEQVIAGIAEGCRQAGCALVGGETAEMPGMYSNNDYDLAGFCVGIVEQDDIIDGSLVKHGDVVIGIPSSGPHANGYSLIRKMLQQKKLTLQDALNSQQTFADVLLQPTRIYTDITKALMPHIAIHAIAHITGGGLVENIPRVLPPHTKATLDPSSWPLPDIFSWLKFDCDIPWPDMYRTFNCGIGLVMCVAEQDADTLLTVLKSKKQEAYVIGVIGSRIGSEAQVQFL